MEQKKQTNIRTLDINQTIDKIMSLDAGERFDFAASVSFDGEGFDQWYGATVVDEFDRRTALIGCYGGGILATINLDDNKDCVYDDIKNALDAFIDFDWEREGCYVEEDVGIPYEQVYSQSVTVPCELSAECHKFFYEDTDKTDSFEFLKETFPNGYSIGVTAYKNTEIVFKDSEREKPALAVIATLYDNNGKEVDASDGMVLVRGKWAFKDSNNCVYMLDVKDELTETLAKATEIENPDALVISSVETTRDGYHINASYSSTNGSFKSDNFSFDMDGQIFDVSVVPVTPHDLEKDVKKQDVEIDK